MTSSNLGPESLLLERILFIQELQQKNYIYIYIYIYIYMNYLASVRRTFVYYHSSILYNFPIVSCSLPRRNHSFPDICKF